MWGWPDTPLLLGSALDINPTNDCANAEVLVGNAANVWITKDGSTSATLGGTVTYELDFGNNGNVNAEAVSIIDPLPENLTFVSAVESSTTPLGFVCSYDAGTGSNGTITCSHDGIATDTSALTLIPGDTGTITVTALVADDISLVSAPYTASAPYVITNSASIATVTDNDDDGTPEIETRYVDNTDDHVTPVVMGALASIS